MFGLSFRGDAEASNPESITTIVSMDSGPAPRGASRNDDFMFGVFFSQH
jgi:error-prone DNA polymerase